MTVEDFIDLLAPDIERGYSLSDVIEIQRRGTDALVVTMLDGSKFVVEVRLA